MRKVTLLAAAAFAAAFFTTPNIANAKAKADPAVAAQQNTNKFLGDAANPYMATSKPAAAPKAAKKAKKKAKKKKK